MISSFYFYFSAYLTAVLLHLNTSDIFGLWNTVAGGNGTLSTPGNYNPEEIPQYALDRTSGSKHNSYGCCQRWNSSDSMECGTSSGLHISLGLCPSLLTDFRFRAGNNSADRGPLQITIEGSNQNASGISNGYLITYSGSQTTAF